MENLMRRDRIEEEDCMEENSERQMKSSVAPDVVDLLQFTSEVLGQFGEDHF